MPYFVERKPLTFLEKVYIPEIAKGLATTFTHIFKPKVTMQYPEETWDLPQDYRGAPALVHDEDGRIRCVACTLCELVCPPRAIRIVPGEIGEDKERPYRAYVEREPKEFDIDFTRCIFCGMCEEICPEEAIFMSRVTSITARTREEMVLNKEQLLAIGGVRPGVTKRWNRLIDEAKQQGVPHGELRRPEGAEGGGH